MVLFLSRVHEAADDPTHVTTTTTTVVVAATTTTTTTTTSAIPIYISCFHLNFSCPSRIFTPCQPSRSIITFI
ncbi:hypothetical protein E2C01_048016 [Portunus trituberculatus]|uniref:Uncharacterized protein n=1 Tax=Portunus trituberculatus TaxID=210409 RepID=A0A5B7G920_PORTR|nr:hypothetical protein [Portunus trituberculatus]